MRPLRGSDFWRCEPDGSLRNGGVEFVHSSPLRGSNLLASLNELGQHLRQYNEEDVTSVRTSVHVHIDTRDMGEVEKRRFLLLCVVMEPALYSMSGEKRRSNPYCQSLTAMRNPIRRSCIEQGWRVEDAAYSWEKYTSVNLTRYPDLGTFEFRTLEGTTDMGRVKDFIGVCTMIKQKAREIEDVLDPALDLFDVAEEVFAHANPDNLDSDIAQGIAALRHMVKGTPNAIMAAGYEAVETVELSPGQQASLGLPGITSLPTSVAQQLLGA